MKAPLQPLPLWREVPTATSMGEEKTQDGALEIPTGKPQFTPQKGEKGRLESWRRSLKFAVWVEMAGRKGGTEAQRG